MQIKASQIHSEHVVAAEPGWSAVYRNEAESLAFVPIVAWAIYRLVDGEGNVFTKLSGLTAFDAVGEDVRFYRSPDGRFWDRGSFLPFNEKQVLEALAYVDQDANKPATLNSPGQDRESSAA